MSRNLRYGLSRARGEEDSPTTREACPLTLLALAISVGPFLVVMVPFLVVILFGLVSLDVALPLLYLGVFFSYAVLLPLAAGRTLRVRERRRKVADEMVAFFSSKIVNLYSVSEMPAVARDPRTMEAYALYLQAERELEENLSAPLLVRETIEWGIFLVDGVLADIHRPPRQTTASSSSPGKRAAP